MRRVAKILGMDRNTQGHSSERKHQNVEENTDFEGSFHSDGCESKYRAEQLGFPDEVSCHRFLQGRLRLDITCMAHSDRHLHPFE